MKRHWKHPYHDIVIVPIEELVECYDGLDKKFPHDQYGRGFTVDEEMILEHWQSCGGKFPLKNHPLDAYILPQPSGWHDIGIRYGNEPSEYLSPPANKEKTSTLLKRYS